MGLFIGEKPILVLVYSCWDDGLGQTDSSVLWLVGMNLFVQNHNHYCGDESLGSEPQSLLWG